MDLKYKVLQQENDSLHKTIEKLRHTLDLANEVSKKHDDRAHKLRDSLSDCMEHLHEKFCDEETHHSFCKCPKDALDEDDNIMKQLNDDNVVYRLNIRDEWT